MTAVIDLRSDTVTRPVPGMRRAMADAEVGDDVFGDDPTVNRLEARAAELMGKEAAVFVPSGTMANLVAILTHARPGEAAVLGDESHIFHYELGGVARIAGVVTHTVPNAADGGMDLEAVRAALRTASPLTPRRALLAIENTHNRCGGAPLSRGAVATLAEAAHEHGAAVHLDGARIFNAATALGADAAEIAAPCDSTSFCLSKGLGAPVGSLLCGSKAFVAEARQHRKLLGGGMRQAGVLAAAGLYALDHHISRLGDDHANARTLAEGLRTLGRLTPNQPRSNIIIVDVAPGTLERWMVGFADAGILVSAFGASRFRMVTHLDVTERDVAEVLRRIDTVMGAIAA